VLQIDVELAVGETVRVGDQLVTVIDVEGEEISVRIDPVSVTGDENLDAALEVARPPKK